MCCLCVCVIWHVLPLPWAGGYTKTITSTASPWRIEAAETLGTLQDDEMLGFKMSLKMSHAPPDVYCLDCFASVC